jgi:cytochrome b
VSATVRIWDLPTRLFHWSLAVCVLGSIVSVNIGGAAVGWHFRFGYAILTLVLFRLLWGFAGPSYARFSSFPPRPGAALRYLREGSGERAGHSPLGALSVYALIAAIALQAATGLFANDAVMWDGPLKGLVSNAASDLITRLHKINRFVVIALILLHLGAIAFYAKARGRNLVTPMLTGDAPTSLPGVAGAQPARDDPAMRLRALALLALSALAVWALLRLGASASPGF